MLPPPDQAQRDRALAADQSFIVQAPAGSGKTSLLVQRYLHLLATVKRPEEILAITFTRAAAMEMKQRVLLALSEDNPLTETIRRQDQANHWQLARNPHLLKIQTIDSFATELATQIPGKQSAEGMRIEEDPEPIYQQAAQNVLAKLFADDPANLYVGEFLAALDNYASTAERLLTIMLSKRDQWLDVATLITTLALNNSAEIEATLSAALDDLRRKILTSLELRLTDNDRNMVLRLAEATESQPRIEDLLPVMLTQSGSIRKTVDRRQSPAFNDKALKAETLAWFNDLNQRNLGSLLHVCSKLPGELQNVSPLIATGVTLALCAAELEQLLQKRRCLDFTGILMRAMQGLRDDDGATDLALYWDYRIGHLLIDEFQDTSRSQHQFFSTLTEGWSQGDGNTFFAVGDPMQSIYRFRDADVSIFSQCWDQGLPTVALEPLQLSANFRSAESLVDWNNRLFASLFPQNSLPELGAIRFSPAIARGNKPDNERRFDQTVQLHSFMDEQQEATAIASHIQTLLIGADPNDNETIGILCRARSHLPTLLEALKRAGIAFTSTDIDALADEPIVNDLLSLHSLLLRPTQRLPWFSMLRSPLVGLTLSQLEAFASAPDLLSYAGQLAEAEPAVERFVSAYAWGQQRLYELPVCEVIEGTWMRMGGVDAYRENSLPHAQRWFELIENMTEDALDPELVQSKTADLYAQDANPAQVSVMTIHKSKGLEFTHVVLPNLGKKSRPEESDLLQWRPTDNGLLIGIKKDPVHNWLTFEEKTRNENEIKRVLYVACTRAEQSLWLSSASQVDRPSGLAKYLPDMQHHEGDDQHSANRVAEQPLPKGAVPISRQSELIHLPRDYQWQAESESSAPRIEIFNPAESEINELPTSDIEDERSNRFNLSLGNLVHRSLAFCGDREAQNKQTDSSLIEGSMLNWLGDLDVDPSQWHAVMGKAKEHVQRTLDDPTGRWIIQSHPYGWFEWPVTAVVQQTPRRFVIDRLFVSDNVLWIVDFKTSEPTNGMDLAHFFKEEVQRYHRQLSQYQAVLSLLFSQKNNQYSDLLAELPMNKALYFTGLGHLELIN